MGKYEFEGPDAMSTEDEKIVEALTEAEVTSIDEWVLSSVEEKWRKVAMIVARVIKKSDEAGVLREVPDIFFAMRIHHHCKVGILELRGDKSRMRYCEVHRVA